MLQTKFNKKLFLEWKILQSTLTKLKTQLQVVFVHVEYCTTSNEVCLNHLLVHSNDRGLTENTHMASQKPRASSSCTMRMDMKSHKELRGVKEVG